MASEIQLTEWHNDFAQAKAALRNLEVLIKALVQSQLDTANRLKWLFTNYDEFVADDCSQETKAAIHEQLRLFERIEHNLNITSNKFATKATAQLDAARSQVAFVHQTLGKLKSLKPPQYDEAAQKLSHQVPEFLNLFDAFLARFTLQIRIQQADYFKQLGGAFTHAGQPEPIRPILEHWRSEYQQIMPAVEALKSVNPQPLPPRPHGHSTSVLDDRHLTNSIEKSESVLMAPVKWVHSKLTHELKEVKFSDPSAGLFHHSGTGAEPGAVPRATDGTTPGVGGEDSVRAIYDFKGDTDSDLQFKRGDIIKIVDRGTDDDPNWWCGEINGRRGLFPKNHVEELYEHHHRHSRHHPSADEYVPKIDESQQQQQPQQPQHQPEEEEFGAFTKHPEEGEHPPAKPPRPTKKHLEEETSEVAQGNNEALPLAGSEVKEGHAQQEVGGSTAQPNAAPDTSAAASAAEKPALPARTREAATPTSEETGNTLETIKIPTSSSALGESEPPVGEQEQQKQQQNLDEPLLDVPTLKSPKLESAPLPTNEKGSTELPSQEPNVQDLSLHEHRPSEVNQDSADELL